MEWLCDIEWWVELSEVARNFAIVAGGAVGLWLAWSRTRALNKQTDTSATSAEQDRREHIASLFDSSLERLNHREYWVRLGAVLVLEQIVEAEPDRADAVAAVLSSYLAAEFEYEPRPLDRADIVEVQRFLAELTNESI